MAIGGNKGKSSGSGSASPGVGSSLQEAVAKVDAAIDEIQAKKLADLTEEKRREVQLFEEQKKLHKELNNLEKEDEKKKQKAEQKSLADEIKTKMATARAQHDLFVSVADKLPSGISEAVKTLASTAISLKGLGKGALSVTGVMTGVGGAIGAIGELFTAGLQEKEKLRRQSMASEELRRSLDGSSEAAKDLIKSTVTVGNVLGDFGPQLMATSLDYAKAHFKTIEATKKWQMSVAQLALPENLGKDAQEVLAKITEAGDKAYAGQGGTDIGMMFKSMSGETIKKLGGTEGVTKIMQQFQKETGKRTITTADDSARLTEIINNVTSKVQLTPDMMIDPIADLQQVMSQLMGSLADAFIRVLLPVAIPVLRFVADILPTIANGVLDLYDWLSGETTSRDNLTAGKVSEALSKAADNLTELQTTFNKIDQLQKPVGAPQSASDSAETTQDYLKDVTVSNETTNNVTQPVNITINGDVGDPDALKGAIIDAAKHGMDQALASVRRSMGGKR